MSEGRQCNIISDRKAFISLIPQDASILEIGPFANPLAIGPKVKYFDVLTTKQLQDRAASLGLEVARVPQVNYVSATADLSIVKDEFDVVISSHAIEHQPDLIRHLQQVEKLLVRGDGIFCLFRTSDIPLIISSQKVRSRQLLKLICRAIRPIP